MVLETLPNRIMPSWLRSYSNLHMNITMANITKKCVKTDKDSCIVYDANDWAVETMSNSCYPLELFMRVVAANLERMKILNDMPKLVFY